MTNLTREETVWLQAYCAAIKTGSTYPKSFANDCLRNFELQFPPSPPPQKESKGVYVTRESLAEAWTSFVSVNTDSEYFKRFCAALGLKE